MAWDDGLEEESPAYGIASSNEERIRVIAGPGTGKSFAMKRRVARLLEGDIDPERVLAVTFTRVATEDLHRELVGLGVDGAEDLSGRTLHSLAMSILMRQHVLQTLGRSPRPLNKFELEPLLEDLSADHGNKRERRRLISGYEAAWARLQHENPGDARTLEEQAFVDELVEWLTLHEAMLIGEVIPYLYQYLRDNPGAPELQEYDHVLIDEYQDLNRVEQETLALLGVNGSVCVIGDDDQSIYSFKHAHPAGIREWGESNGAADHEILECRRCPTTIVRVANSLISHNGDREEREIEERDENGAGELVIRQYPNSVAEAEAIVAKIQALVDDGVAPGQIIVLAQRDVFARPIYTRLREAGVPAKSYYAETELDSHSAQERFAILKLYLNNEDRVALRWLLGRSHARWRAPAYARILDHVRATGESPWQTLSRLRNSELNIPYTTQLVEVFGELLEELDSLDQCVDIYEFIETWLGDDELELLRDTVGTFAEDAEDPQQLFDAIYDAITRPEVPLEVEEVRVMSLHKSKGLSSPHVFIAGCVEGLIPGQPDPGTPHAVAAARLEEDRRLFYVGITRVKASPEEGLPGYLALTYPQSMPSADAFRSQIRPVRNRAGVAELRASRFIGELGPNAPQPEAATPL